MMAVKTIHNNHENFMTQTKKQVSVYKLANMKTQNRHQNAAYVCSLTRGIFGGGIKKRLNYVETFKVFKKKSHLHIKNCCSIN